MKISKFKLLIIIAVSILVGGLATYFFVQNEGCVPRKNFKIQNRDQAIDALKNNSIEISQWIKLLTEQKKIKPSVGTPTFTVEKEDSRTYFIHAYENQADHTATKGWYYVDMETGRVSEAVN